MPVDPSSENTDLSASTADFYRSALHVLNEADVPFLVGGAYAFHTGVARHTKDLDVFVRTTAVERALQALSGVGYRTEVASPHWLAKAHAGEDTLDLIFRSGRQRHHRSGRRLVRARPRTTCSA